MIALLIYLFFTTSTSTEDRYEYFVSSQSTYIITFESIIRKSSVSSSYSYIVGLEMGSDGYNVDYSNVQSTYRSIFVPTLNQSYTSGQESVNGSLIEPDAYIDGGRYNFQTDSCGYISKVERLNKVFFTPKIFEEGPVQRQKIEGHLMALPSCILSVQDKTQLNNPKLGELDGFYVERLNDSTIILTKDELMQTQFYSTLPTDPETVKSFFDSTKAVNSYLKQELEQFYKVVHDKKGMAIRVDYFRDATGSGSAYGLVNVRHGMVRQMTIERLSP